MSEWAAKVLEGVPRHNAQDAKSMTGFASAVWLHEDAAVDAIARMGREMALDVLASSGQAQEAYAAQLAAETERDALRERVARLEGVLTQIAEEASVPVYTWKNGINFKKMYEGWRKIATDRIDIARAALTDRGTA